MPVIFIFIILLVGCASFTRNEQSARNEFVRIEIGEEVGQTFLSRFDGLQGVSIFLQPVQVGSGEIRFELFSDQSSSESIRTSALPIKDISTSGFYNFAFSPIDASTNQDYFYNLSVEGQGIVETGVGAGNSYLSGAQYLNHVAQNSQSTFRLDYEPKTAVWGLIKMGFNWMWLLFISFFLLAVPGYAALMWMYPRWSLLDWISKLGLSLGIGLAFYPVLFLWSNTIGVQLGIFNALVLPILGLVLIGLKKFLDTRKPRTAKNHSQNQFLWINMLPDLVFLVIITMIIFTRFWPIRNLDAPMWGDSYQHTMITQLLVDNGGLFSSWEPYANLESFTYHFGFHSFAAAFHWLTRLDVIQATLWAGQILNIFAIIVLYPLALSIGKSRWAGIIAVLIAGLISPMPMFYTNWGRYT
ncbi:MAG: hypothetical protein ACWGN2_11485, partial [Anaerolineales bacterium]